MLGCNIEYKEHVLKLWEPLKQHYRKMGKLFPLMECKLEMEQCYSLLNDVKDLLVVCQKYYVCVEGYLYTFFCGHDNIGFRQTTEAAEAVQ